jgi:excisionase family DNA binding protein
MKRKDPVQLLSVKDCAKLLSISEKSLWRLIHQRRITVVRINRRVLISEIAIKEFTERHTVQRIDSDSLADEMIDG